MKGLVALVLLMQLCLLEAQPLDLLYFTDAHRIYPVDDVEGGRGGVARLKAVVDQVRAENSDTLVIHGGDLCGGVLFGGVYQGVPMIEAFNRIPIDLCNFGQHEFDFGAPHTLELVQASDFQWFSSNLKTRDGDSFAGVPSVVYKKRGDLTVAFIGLTDAMNTTSAGPGVVQEDLFQATGKVLQNMSQVDIVVAVTQTPLETNRKLLQQYPAIDLILTEEQYEYAGNVFYEGRRPVVATAGNMSSVAHIHIDANKRIRISMIPLDASVESDPELAKVEQYYLKEIDRLLAEEVGELKVALDVSSGHQGESRAGNLVTDAFRSFYHADVGMLNSGSLRADIPAGRLTLKSVRSLLPFGNRVVLFSVHGKDLKQLLKEHARMNKSGRLLHVSGIQYDYRAEQDEIRVYHEGKLIADDEPLTVATSDYFFSKLKLPMTVLVAANDSRAAEDYQVLADYCKAKQELRPQLEGRIKIRD